MGRRVGPDVLRGGAPNVLSGGAQLLNGPTQYLLLNCVLMSLE